MVKARLLPMLVLAGGAVVATTACSPADVPPRSAADARKAAVPSSPAQPAPVQTAALAPLSVPRAGDAEVEPARATAAPRKGRESVAVLQLGDSHTAADYFTGEVRRILQARYGDGGVGYLEVGHPHPGVHKVDLDVKADAGWSYQGIQKSGDAGQFALSGFLAQTSLAGQGLTFSTPAATPYTDVEVEAQVGPGQGAVDVSVDGRIARHADLAAAEKGRTVIDVPAPGGRGAFHRLEIRTTRADPVTVLSVAARDRDHGLTYSNIGFPGATVDILNKFPEATVREALHRLRPRVVVLSFGTNEGFNDNLDLARYRERYESVIRTIRAGAPGAEIVMIGPAFANRLAPDCRKDPDGKACSPAPDGAAKPAAPAAAEADCPWPTPPQLDRVRDAQREIASHDGIAFWDWSTIMPRHCGAEVWVTMTPHLMTPDHVHFTPEGYRRGGQAFAAFIDPIIAKSLRDIHAVSND